MNDHPASAMERRRIEAGVTVAEAAIRTGRCTTTIARYEAGRTTPPQHVLLALASLYGCSVTELVEGV